jgi:nicotinamide mononucleotide transporter
MSQTLLAALKALTLPETLAVALGIAYLLLAVRRSRWCWLAGAASSAIFGVLFARARLPMQAALQVYYVAVSVYGFRQWSPAGEAAQPAVSTWPWRLHLAAGAGVVLVSVLTAQWLERETRAAWPYLDSLTTWASLFTTWLVARMKLENWVYWVAIDAAIAFLAAAQKLYLTGLLYAIYAVIAISGFISWRRAYRSEHVPS